MKSFYLKEQTLGEELTKLDLNLVENKTESQKKNRSKSRGNYSESEDSVAEDLEPVSSKLAKFKIESPTLATPFGNSLRSKPSRKGSQTPSNDLIRFSGLSCRSLKHRSRAIYEGNVCDKIFADILLWITFKRFVPPVFFYKFNICFPILL